MTFIAGQAASAVGVGGALGPPSPGLLARAKLVNVEAIEAEILGYVSGNTEIWRYTALSTDAHLFAEWSLWFVGQDGLNTGGVMKCSSRWEINGGSVNPLNHQKSAGAWPGGNGGNDIGSPQKSGADYFFQMASSGGTVDIYASGYVMEWEVAAP